MAKTPKVSAARAARGQPVQDIAVLQQEIATTGDGRDITRPFMAGLQQPRDTRLNAAIDWGVYDRVLLDDQVFSTLQQRRSAVVSREWTVLPGDEADPRSVEAADKFTATLTRIGWDRITDKMLYAIYNGYAVAEIIWEPRDGLLDFKQIKVRHARRFRFDDKAQLRLLTRSTMLGEIVPSRKFWVFALGGADDDEIYGRGLAEWLYWPTLFKRNGLRFWNIFLDKFGSPTAIGKYRPGTPKADQMKLLAALQAIATDTGIAIPEGMAVELLQASRSGTGDYATLVDKMDAAISKIVLSQTMTTDNGSSRSQGEVHADVKLAVVKSDADLLSDSFNADDGPARWWTDVNFGGDVAAPVVRRIVEEEADTKAQADTDAVLKGLGWERDDESFQDTYGEGYVRVAAAVPASAPAAANPADPAIDPAAVDPAATQASVADPVPGADPASFAADDLRPLYVYRRLLNASDLVEWAMAQGFKATLPAADMHVTITYSSKPVNWMKMGGFWGWTGDNAEHLVPPGGPRLVEQFGDNAVVLVFFSGHLEQRNQEMRAAGASWDHQGYFPHVTFTYDASDIDLAKVEPYKGELRFGPEIFEPIQSDWESNLREVSFAAPAGPPVTLVPAITPAQAAASAADKDPDDALIDQSIADAGYAASKALTDPMLGGIKTANSADELAALLNASPGDTAPLSTALENTSFAMTMAAENEG